MATYVRSIIYTALGDSVPEYKERRGTTWDRVVVMNQANKAAELRRRARNEKRRQRPKRPKPLPPPPVFEFHPGGTITNPELDLLAEQGAEFTAISEERGTVQFNGGGESWVVIDPIDGSLNVRKTLPNHSLSIAIASAPNMAAQNRIAAFICTRKNVISFDLAIRSRSTIAFDPVSRYWRTSE